MRSAWDLGREKALQIRQLHKKRCRGESASCGWLVEVCWAALTGKGQAGGTACQEEVGVTEALSSRGTTLPVLEVPRREETPELGVYSRQAPGKASQGPPSSKSLKA